MHPLASDSGNSNISKFWDICSSSNSRPGGVGRFKVGSMERMMKLHEAWESQLKTNPIERADDLVWTNVFGREGSIGSRGELVEFKLLGGEEDKITFFDGDFFAVLVGIFGVGFLGFSSILMCQFLHGRGTRGDIIWCEEVKVEKRFLGMSKHLGILDH